MADKDRRPGTLPEPQPQSAAARARATAKPVRQFTSAWEGIAPKILDPNCDDGNLPQSEIDDLLDHPICVYGYSERDGNQGKFFVILCSPADADNLYVVVTGAAVVLKKLSIVKDKHAFPVVGRFVRCKGKTYEYYDFV